MSLSQTEVLFYYPKLNYCLLTLVLSADFAEGAKKHIGDLKKRVDKLEGRPHSFAKVYLGRLLFTDLFNFPR